VLSIYQSVILPRVGDKEFGGSCRLNQLQKNEPEQSNVGFALRNPPRLAHS
jgi:hypothetical protein